MVPLELTDLEPVPLSAVTTLRGALVVVVVVGAAVVVVVGASVVVVVTPLRTSSSLDIELKNDPLFRTKFRSSYFVTIIFCIVTLLNINGNGNGN